MAATEGSGEMARVPGCVCPLFSKRTVASGISVRQGLQGQQPPSLTFTIQVQWPDTHQEDSQGGMLGLLGQGELRHSDGVEGDSHNGDCTLRAGHGSIPDAIFTHYPGTFPAARGVLSVSTRSPGRPLLCAFSSFQPWGVWASGPRSALQSVHVWMVFKRSLRQTPQWPLGARRHPTTGYRT